jgi:hypothetical protein
MTLINNNNDIQEGTELGAGEAKYAQLSFGSLRGRGRRRWI